MPPSTVGPVGAAPGDLWAPATRGGEPPAEQQQADLTWEGVGLVLQHLHRHCKCEGTYRCSTCTGPIGSMCSGRQLLCVCDSVNHWRPLGSCDRPSCLSKVCGMASRHQSSPRVLVGQVRPAESMVQAGLSPRSSCPTKLLHCLLGNPCSAGCALVRRCTRLAPKGQSQAC